MNNIASWRGRLAAFFTFAPIRAVIGFVWVGAAIGLGSAAASLLPSPAKVFGPLLLAVGALLGYYTFVPVVERRQVTELLGPGVVLEALAGTAIGMGLFGVVIGTLHIAGVYTVEGTRMVSVLGPVNAMAAYALQGRKCPARGAEVKLGSMPSEPRQRCAGQFRPH